MSSPAIDIRACTGGDESQVIRLLLDELWPDSAIEKTLLGEAFRTGLSSPQCHYWCAVLESEIVGFCSLNLQHNLWQQGLMGRVDELVVSADYRGQGIGSRLLQNAILVGCRKGCRRIELDSAFHRTHAHAFYKAHGFENRGVVFSFVVVEQSCNSWPGENA